ncbi:putative ribonuclease H-like domain-containing protein, partial [Tanacetum coccineum]
GSRPDGLLILIYYKLMNFEPLAAGNQINKNEIVTELKDLLVADDASKKTNEEPANKGKRNGQEKEGGASNKENDQNRDSIVSPSVSTAGQNFTNADDLPRIPDLEDTSIFSGAYDDEDVGVEADLNNLETTMNFCGMKGIKREFSVARTPQQNGVAKRNNRVLVTKPHNKTPYELLHGRPPSISFMRPFGYPVTILNTIDPLGKFDGKVDEGFFVGYSINSKAFRVFNTRTRKVEENLHITFLENKPNVAGSRPDWLFDIDLLTNSMNYEPVTARNQTNKNAGIKDNVDAVPTQQYILLPLLYDSPQSSKDVVADDVGKNTNKEPANEGERNGQEKEGGASNKEDDQNVQDFRVALDNLLFQQKEGYANNTNRDSTISLFVSTAGQSFTNTDDLPTGPFMPDLEDTTNLLNTSIFSGAYDDEDVGAEADLNSLETTLNVSPIPTTIIHKDHTKDQIIGDINSSTQTRRMTKISEELAMKVTQAFQDPSWIEAMQDELLQNKKDKRGIVVRNKVRLVAQGYTQEEGIDYDEVFAPIARIEAIRLFLAYASFMGFIVYQMDVKSAFLYGTIEEEVAWYETLSTYLLENGFRSGIIVKTLFIKKDKGDILFVQVMQRYDGIFISQDKYMADILKKFEFVTMKTTSTPIETHKALLKEEEAEDAAVHLYRSMIGSLMYLIASRPDIMFAVCSCARDSPFNLEAFSDSDYAGASLDSKSTTRGCQFLGKRLISWQCKKQTIVANSTTEAEYVAAANCCGQVLWIQNQMLDYGFNFMNTKIYIDNESTICIVKNPVFHSKTKHIEIRHHFIRDSYKKKLIQVIKIHTDHNVADLLTKAFDVSRKAKRTTKIFQSSGPIHLDADETVYKEWEDIMERAVTTASSLEAEQNSGNIHRTQSMQHLMNLFLRELIQAVSIGAKVTFRGRKLKLVFLDKQVEGMSRHKGIYVISSHSKKVFANTKRPGHGFSRKVTPLFSTMMVQATKDVNEDSAAPTDSYSTPVITQPSSSKPQKKKVLDLEKAKTTQVKEITSLKKRVKQLEKRRKSRTSGLRRLRKEDVSKQGRKIKDLDADAEVTLVTETQERNDEEMLFDVHDDLQGDKVVAEKKVSTADPVTTAGEGVTTANVEVTTASASTTTIDELTLAQTLIEIKAAKPKAVTTDATTTITTNPRLKGL